MTSAVKTVTFWVRNARITALPQSLMPALLSLCVAWGAGDFSLTLGVLAVCGAVVGHLGINLFDDYFDYRVKSAQVRDELTHKGIRARIAKCKYLTSGAATVPQLLAACIIFCVVSLFCGAVIFIWRGVTVLYLAAIAMVLGVSYSGGPLRFSYRGFGELLVGLMFGPLLMNGVYYSATGRMDISMALISLSTGLLVANIVYVHAIMDYEPDKQVGKMTFAVLLDNKRSMLNSLLILLIAAYGLVTAGVVVGYLSVYSLAVLLTLPMAVSLYRLMAEFVRDPKSEYAPTVWMGPMPALPKMQRAGIAWFMIRWLLARNLLTFFCLIMAVVSLIS